MDHDAIRSAVFEAIETSLSAQIKAMRALRNGERSRGSKPESSASRSRKKGRSHIAMAYDILAEASQPLHVNDIIQGIASRFAVQVDRESLVSALSKRVMRQDRFVRTDKNTYALLETDRQDSPS